LTSFDGNDDNGVVTFVKVSRTVSDFIPELDGVTAGRVVVAPATVVALSSGKVVAVATVGWQTLMAPRDDDSGFSATEFLVATVEVTTVS
jgi:hypothetical protein